MNHLFKTITDLTAWLDTHDFPRETWGRGEAKTLGDLWAEYESGETAFEDDPPARRVAVVQLRLKRGDRVLMELAQEFEDGRRRERYRLPSEKIKPGEDPLAAARRCLREELGFESDEGFSLAIVETSESVSDSPSYPGLRTRYHFVTVDGATDALPDEDFWHENSAEGDIVRRHLWGWRYPA
ncbi:MAG: NUDIX domain-containing protein [Chloroflexota bacterium]